MKRINANHQGIPVTIEFDNDVYSPGKLTSTLCDIMEIKPGDQAIDVGCGTGYIGITAALLGASKTVCIDSEPAAIKWTEHNAGLNHVRNLCAIHGKALDPVENEPADVIVTIPPQMPFPTNFNPWRYGGYDGTDIIVKIIKQASSILNKKGGRMFLVHSALAFPSKIRDALSSHGFTFDIIKTVDKDMDADIIGQVPGLKNYLIGLAHRNMAEISEHKGKLHYPVWFYRSVL